MEIKINTKFDVGDNVWGFYNGIPKLLKIDYFDIEFKKFDRFNPMCAKCDIKYFATPVDNETNYQQAYMENSLYTKEELKDLVNKLQETNF